MLVDRCLGDFVVSFSSMDAPGNGWLRLASMTVNWPPKTGFQRARCSLGTFLFFLACSHVVKHGDVSMWSISSAGAVEAPHLLVARQPIRRAQPTTGFVYTGSPFGLVSEFLVWLANMCW